jgi:hypothetical protein
MSNACVSREPQRWLFLRRQTDCAVVECAHQSGHLLCMRLQREVSGVKHMNLRIREISLISGGAGGQNAGS